MAGGGRSCRDFDDRIRRARVTAEADRGLAPSRALAEQRGVGRERFHGEDKLGNVRRAVSIRIGGAPRCAGEARSPALLKRQRDGDRADGSTSKPPEPIVPRIENGMRGRRGGVASCRCRECPDADVAHGARSSVPAMTSGWPARSLRSSVPASPSLLHVAGEVEEFVGLSVPLADGGGCQRDVWEAGEVDVVRRHFDVGQFAENAAHAGAARSRLGDEAVLEDHEIGAGQVADGFGLRGAGESQRDLADRRAAGDLRGGQIAEREHVEIVAGDGTERERLVAERRLTVRAHVIRRAERPANKERVDEIARVDVTAEAVVEPRLSLAVRPDETGHRRVVYVRWIVYCRGIRAGQHPAVAEDHGDEQRQARGANGFHD